MLAKLKFFRCILAFVFFSFVSIQSFAQNSPAQLKSYSTKKKLGIEQVSLNFDQNVVGKGHFLRASAAVSNARYYVDFSSASLNKNFPAPALDQDFKLIQGIRIAQKDSATIRIVLDLPKTLNTKNVVLDQSGTSFTISLAQKATDLAILQLEESGPVAQQVESIEEIEAPSSSIKKNSPSPIDIEIPSSQEVQIKPKNNPAPKALKEVVIKPSKTRSKKKAHLIIIDAGHGGHDSGARGPFYKTNEKDVTLSIAKRLKKILDKDSKYKVLMTREKDTHLELWDRTNFANNHNGDLFVSIHANANVKSSAHGVSTYFLHNADDEESLRVAMRENGELAIPKAQKKTQNDAYFLEVMKASMLKNFHTVQSTDLARIVQNSLFKNLSQNYSKVYNRGVKSARFYVLTGANMPAILVETSFITNKLEEKRLRSSAYQYQIASAIYKGIQGYFKQQDKNISHARLY